VTRGRKNFESRFLKERRKKRREVKKGVLMIVKKGKRARNTLYYRGARMNKRKEEKCTEEGEKHRYLREKHYLKERRCANKGIRLFK